MVDNLNKDCVQNEEQQNIIINEYQIKLKNMIDDNNRLKHCLEKANKIDSDNIDHDKLSDLINNIYFIDLNKDILSFIKRELQSQIQSENENIINMNFESFKKNFYEELEKAKIKKDDKYNITDTSWIKDIK